MKKILLIIILLSNLSYSQNFAYKVIYKIAHDTISNDILLSNDPISVNSDNFAETLESFLLFNSKKSIYLMDKPMRNEDTDVTIYTLGLLQIYLDTIFQLRDKRIKLLRVRDEKKYLWEKDTIIGRRTWKITNETGKLGNYTVIKAIAGKNITAWFTPDIPVPFGPYGEGGLPGLILKIQLGRRIIYANKIIPLKEPIKIPEPKGKRVSAQEMREKRMKEFA